MIHWHTHAVAPKMGETALIAIFDPEDNEAFLLGEIYRFCERHGCWMSETTHLKLKHDTFFWVSESTVLGSLP